MNAPDPVERFLMRARVIAAAREHDAGHHLYVRLKADLDREFPMIEQAERDRAVRVIADVCGV